MKEKICSAIESRRIVFFKYGSRNTGYRTVEPFAYGVNEAGEELLRGYQTEGYTESDTPFGWRLYRVAKIIDLEIGEEIFDDGRDDYNPNDPVMKMIFCEVELVPS